MEKIKETGPSERIIPEQRYLSCIGCEFYSRDMVKSGFRPIYESSCSHSSETIFKPMNGDNTPDWCPLLPKIKIKFYCGYYQATPYLHYDVAPVIVLDDNLPPKQQLIEFDKFYNRDKDKNPIFFTNSPYVLHYLNLLITSGFINFDELDVIHIKHNQKGEESLKLKTEKCIDTKYCSETLNWIHYESQKYKKK
jgi:hypothetical protein